MDTKTTYTHRVAIMEVTQIIMDIEAENDLDSIKEKALKAYYEGNGDQEEGLSFPSQVVLYPWLEKGQNPPQGSAHPEPTIINLSEFDVEYTPEDEGEAEVIEFPK